MGSKPQESAQIINGIHAETIYIIKQIANLGFEEQSPKTTKMSAMGNYA